MLLSAFILAKMEPILQEWEDFARSLGAVSEAMDIATLRDHAEGILRELAVDLQTPQSDAQQEAKSKGRAPARDSTREDTSAEMHGKVRAFDGFSLEQMVSEFRALRASVLRLWTRDVDAYNRAGCEQITRFNEAIDEALAESVKKYAYDLDEMLVAARARERLAALGTLSAGLGHDMSNVLMPMRTMLKQMEQASIPPEVRTMVAALDRSVEHLRGLTQGLRSLAVDPAIADASPETTDLQEWWKEAVTPYKWALTDDIHLHAGEIAHTKFPPVRVPKHVLMQAIFNLVQNAAEAIGKRGGNIWVSAALSGNGATVSLTVRDDGHGMDAATLAQCTDPFFTTRPRARGTGLGLSLVRTAIERHEGRVEIESQPGKGASFTLVLPVAMPGEASAVRQRQAIVTVRDLRQASLIRAILAEMDVEAVAATKAPAAAAKADKAGKAGTSHASLWVADDSADAGEVRRFLDEHGADARVVMLGGVAEESGVSGDRRFVQISADATHAELTEALRRAVTGGLGRLGRGGAT